MLRSWIYPIKVQLVILVLGHHVGLDRFGQAWPLPVQPAMFHRNWRGDLKLVIVGWTLWCFASYIITFVVANRFLVVGIPKHWVSSCFGGWWPSYC